MFLYLLAGAVSVLLKKKPGEKEKEIRAYIREIKSDEEDNASTFFLGNRHSGKAPIMALTRRIEPEVYNIVIMVWEPTFDNEKVMWMFLKAAMTGLGGRAVRVIFERNRITEPFVSALLKLGFLFNTEKLADQVTETGEPIIYMTAVRPPTGKIRKQLLNQI